MINVVGIGPGDRDYLTPLGLRLIQQSDWLVGAERQLQLFDDFHGRKRLFDSKLTELAAWLNANREQCITVLASGDPMLYGIGKFLSLTVGGIEAGLSGIDFLAA